MKLHECYSRIETRRSGLMDVAYWVASLSMDPRTKIGSALRIGDGGLFSEANATVCGSPLDEYLGFMTKHEALEHAERLVIGSAAMSLARYRADRDHGRGPIRPDLAVNEIPCADCARAIVTAGIGRVFICGWWQLHVSIHGPDPSYKFLATEFIFRKGGVEFYIDFSGSSFPARRDDMDFRPNAEFFNVDPVF